MIISEQVKELELRKRVPVTLKMLVSRYRTDKELLLMHPENKELLQRRIKEHEKAIIEYVTNDSFQTQLNDLNL